MVCPPLSSPVCFLHCFFLLCVSFLLPRACCTPVLWTRAKKKNASRFSVGWWYCVLAGMRHCTWPSRDILPCSWLDSCQCWCEGILCGPRDVRENVVVGTWHGSPQNFRPPFCSSNNSTIPRLDPKCYSIHETRRRSKARARKRGFDLDPYSTVFASFRVV
jgi:hypothetical protein